MRFVDEVEIEVVGGDGGRPCVSFLREKYRPKGGPAGGDGGAGGSVRFEVDPGMGTLLDFRYRHRVEARRGEDGRGKAQNGRAGEDAVARVPLGTLVFDVATGEQLADLRDLGASVVVAQGGRGGLGNVHFATSTDQAPRRTIPETPGERRRLRLELRLLADVGLVGKPNAGKSTLLRRVSAARPKVADYPFTTLTPQLGVVTCGEERSFVLADVPGLIEGAHEGHGLGHRFLRHLGRTRLLIHLLDLASNDPMNDYDTIESELRRFDPALADRPRIVVGNKIDLSEAIDREPSVRATFADRGLGLHTISAETGTGVDALMSSVCQKVLEGSP